MPLPLLDTYTSIVRKEEVEESEREEGEEMSREKRTEMVGSIGRKQEKKTEEERG